MKQKKKNKKQKGSVDILISTIMISNYVLIQMCNLTSL